MEGVSSWVLSIAGICFVSVIVDLMLPDGKMNSHIKNVMSYAIMLVIILPIPSIINKNFNVEDIFSNTDIIIQDEYIYNINQKRLDVLKSEIENGLNNKGIMGIDISISANIFNSPMEINAIYVDLYNVVISEDAGNINIKTEVVDVVQENINVSKDKVIFYE